MAFKKIQYNRLYEQIIAQIEEFITERELKPGDQLPTERELAEQIGVSRGTVREAFRVLENRGIIESTPGGGRFLRHLTGSVPSASDYDVIAKLRQAAILDLIEARELFETRIVEIACDRAKEDDFELIEKTLTQMEVGMDHDFVGLDSAFHLAIAKATHNIVFENIMKLNLDILAQTREEALHVPGRAKERYNEHVHIFRAMKDRNKGAAVEAVENHLSNIRKIMARLNDDNTVD